MGFDAARPFFLHEARAAGITPSMLRGKSWRRIGSRLYLATDAGKDDRELIAAYRRVLPRSAVFVGLTAGWLHGLDLNPTSPVQVTVSATTSLRSRSGLEVRHCDLHDEIVTVKGLPVSSLPRTLLDLCATLPALDALIAVDMAYRQMLIDKPSLREYAGRAKGRRGAVRLRRLADIAAPAESPMETRLRWLLLQHRLPAPEVQTDLYDEAAQFLGRADLYYPTAHLVIEFDGANHRDRLVSDDRRQNALFAAGYRILRFTTADLSQRPAAVVALVRSALGSPAPPRSARWRPGRT